MPEKIVVFVALAFSADETGVFPGLDGLANATKEAVVNTLMAQKTKLWGTYGIVDIPQAPVKKWRVTVSRAAVRTGPGPSFNATSYANQGDILSGDEVKDNLWLNVGTGWVKTTQVEAYNG